MTERSSRKSGRHRASFLERFSFLKRVPGESRFAFVGHFFHSLWEWILAHTPRFGARKTPRPRPRVPRGRPPLAQPDGFPAAAKLPPGLRRPRMIVPVERPTRPLTREEILYRNTMAFFALVIAAFLFNVVVLSGLQHEVSQQKLGNTFREQLSLATAPTSEGDSDLVLLPNGAPVAYLEIPELGVHEYVVEGTDSSSLALGPGHRRDSVLPGQAGTSVIMGRSAAYGGVFSKISDLQPGSTLSVVTGQGYHVYKVIGLRYAGDPGPAEPAADASRLVLVSARGLPYMPTGLVRVDAQMVSTSPVYPGYSGPQSSVPCSTGTSIQLATSSPKASSSTGAIPSKSPGSSSTSTSSSGTMTPSPTSSLKSTMGSASSSPKPQSVPCPSSSPVRSAEPTTSLTPSPTGNPIQSSTPTTGAQALDELLPSASPALAEVLTAASQAATPISTSPGMSTPGSSNPASPTVTVPTPTSTVPGVGAATKTGVSNLTAAKAFAPGARYTSERTLPPEQRELATDMTTLWALIFALQFLLVIEIAVVWAVRRFSPKKVWIVSVPLLGLAAILVSDQLVRLLPNLT